MRVNLTKKLGRRWRGSGGICHACTPWDLARSRACACAGATQLPLSQRSNPRLESEDGRPKR